MIPAYAAVLDGAVISASLRRWRGASSISRCSPGSGLVRLSSILSNMVPSHDNPARQLASGSFQQGRFVEGFQSELPHRKLQLFLPPFGLLTKHEELPLPKNGVLSNFGLKIACGL